MRSGALRWPVLGLLPTSQSEHSISLPEYSPYCANVLSGAGILACPTDNPKHFLLTTQHVDSLHAMGVGCLHAQEDALQEPYRTFTRHTGPHHFANVAMGAAARLRHQPGDPRHVRRRAPGRYRTALAR